MMEGGNSTFQNFMNLDFESKIFAKVAEKSQNNPVDDLLDSHSRSFILLGSKNVDVRYINA